MFLLIPVFKKFQHVIQRGDEIVIWLWTIKFLRADSHNSYPPKIKIVSKEKEASASQIYTVFSKKASWREKMRAELLAYVLLVPVVRAFVPPGTNAFFQNAQHRELAVRKDTPHWFVTVAEGETAVPDSNESINVTAVSLEASAVTMTDVEKVEISEAQKLMQQVKDAGTAGIISYALWEVAFWTVSIPVVIFGYIGVTGHWPDLSDNDDIAKMGAEAFAFVNFARFAVPLRIGLALSTTPWIQNNVVDKFFHKEEK
jgi:hypothetical protein